MAHFASATEYVSLTERKNTKVACIPITSGDGIIGDFCETCALILREFADVDAFVTEMTDVAGLNEAILKKADMVFMADDNACLCRNLNTGATSDNGYATGRGFASLLYLGAGEKIDDEVLILGAGKVGASAWHFLAERGVALRWYDLLEEKNAHGMDPGLLEKTWSRRDWRFIVDATTAPALIDACHVRPGAQISAPGIPFGLTEAALQKSEMVFRDELPTGIMVMFCEGMKNGRC